MFGTDFSPEPMESTVNELPHLGLSVQVTKAIERENAEKWFPRFKATSPGRLKSGHASKEAKPSDAERQADH